MSYLQTGQTEGCPVGTTQGQGWTRDPLTKRWRPATASECGVPVTLIPKNELSAQVCPEGHRLGSGYVSENGKVRRARADECGSLEPIPGITIERSIRDPETGVSTTQVIRRGEVVEVKQRADRELQRCINAEVPEAYLTTCRSLLRGGASLQETLNQLMSQAEQDAVAQAAQTEGRSKGRNLLLLGVAGAGVVGLALLLRRRKR